MEKELINVKGNIAKMIGGGEQSVKMNVYCYEHLTWKEAQELQGHVEDIVRIIVTGTSRLLMENKTKGGNNNG